MNAKVAKIKQQWDKNKEDEKKTLKTYRIFFKSRERKKEVFFLPAKFCEKFSQCLRNVWVPSPIEECDVCSAK